MKIYVVIITDIDDGDPTLFLRKEDAIDYALSMIRSYALEHDYDYYYYNELEEALDEFEKVESTSLDNFTVALYEREINE